ncbi:MAG: radical SAM protein [Spirochaetota bacterium]
MKVVLISMPDVVPIIIHEMAIHMPNHGIACIAGNIDEQHEVFTIDLVRKRTKIVSYLTKTLKRINPDLIGLSSMTWQFRTCLALIRFIKEILPDVKIVVGGYHTTLMSKEMADSTDTDGVDFMIRGEGEEPFRRLVNALAGTDKVESIPGLSYKKKNRWLHNAPGQLCDLSKLKLPVRDKRRLTSGYHFMFTKIETIETSRGCTRNCNFCSIFHMYGRSYRTYPIERIMADLDYIYYKKKTRLVFITDDNMVLNPKWVNEVCDAIIARKYKNLRLVVQADCASMAKYEPMVAKMAQAGFIGVFLGIENASEKNLKAMHKTGAAEKARQAVANCHRHGLMVIGGLIFGLPNDDEEEIRENYEFLKKIEADASYCQMLSPFPKTPLRDDLIKDGLVTNFDQYERYNGLWANVKTQRLDSDRLQYLFWYHRQVTLGWWTPSAFAHNQKQLWVSVWNYIVKPIMRYFSEKRVLREGWEKQYEKYIQRLEKINLFKDLQGYHRERVEKKKTRSIKK